MTESEEPKLHPEIQEKHGLDNDRNGGTQVHIETEIKVEFDLETIAHRIML